MRRILVLRFMVICFCFSIYNTYAGDPKIKINPFWKYLYSTDSSLNYISNFTSYRHLALPGSFNNFNQDIVKTDSGLYILLAGTGQVYECVKLENDSLVFKRIDSTTHFGYNYGAINFTWNRQVFSFGGYGFWRQNGHLRRFSKWREWEIDNLDKEISAPQGPVYLDMKAGLLYYFHHPVFEAFKNELDSYYENKSLLCVLQLSTGKQTVLGLANNDLMKFENVKPFFISIPTLGGTILLNELGIFLLKYRQNEVYRLVSQKIQNKILAPGNGKIQYAFASADKLFFLNALGNFDSVQVSMLDFAISKDKIFSALPLKINYKAITIGLAFAFIIVVLIFQELKHRSWKNKLAKEEAISQLVPNELEFTELEKLVLAELKKNKSSGIPTTVANMNTLLGLNKKSLEVQKKVRNDIVNSINEKHRKFNRVDEELIERVRSTIDKRYFEYKLNTD